MCVQEKSLVVRETPAANARSVFAQYDPEGTAHTLPSLNVCGQWSTGLNAWLQCLRYTGSSPTGARFLRPENPLCPPSSKWVPTLFRVGLFQMRVKTVVQLDYTCNQNQTRT